MFCCCCVFRSKGKPNISFFLFGSEVRLVYPSHLVLFVIPNNECGRKVGPNWIPNWILHGISSMLTIWYRRRSEWGNEQKSVHFLLRMFGWSTQRENKNNKKACSFGTFALFPLVHYTLSYTATNFRINLMSLLDSSPWKCFVWCLLRQNGAKWGFFWL